VLVPPALTPGTWQVHWSTLTLDGHRVKGDYAFRVK
jgi:methionine-rich copper-binding protein CopC